MVGLVVTDIARWAIRIDIVVNAILVVGAIVLAIVLATKGLTPFPFS
jgi:hypothetical protein